MKAKKKQNRFWPGLLACIAISIATGSIGSLFTFSALADWYPTLIKPWFTPPNWIFGPVWTLLYGMMGASVYLVYRTDLKKQDLHDAISVFGLQFFMNIFWSYLFFWLRSPYWGLVGIVTLWLAILGTVLIFNKINRIASYLLVPYLLWVTFALILNTGIYFLNK